MVKLRKEITGMKLTNYERIRNMSKNQLAKFLMALKANSCPFPKLQYCEGCIAKNICSNWDVHPTVYSVHKWLSQEVLK